MMDQSPVAVVVIGRNEGERLKRCLQSMPLGMPVVYVDSGSTDGSIDYARKVGVTVVPLDMSAGFTAARARNVGWRRLVNDGVTNLEFVQFIDGDCELDRTWLDAAITAIRQEPLLAVVFGRRRERFPAHSIYNRMCDDEWNVPVGIVSSCGGDALFRVDALKKTGGYSDDLIAGEEPDLCLRLRQLGWFVRRIDGEMTLHDANMVTFGSWWKRTERGGFAYAAHVLRHGQRSDPQWRRQLNSIVFWGSIWPIGCVALAALMGLWHPMAAAAILIALPVSYVLQALRIAARKYRSGGDRGFAVCYGGLLTIGKFAELIGVVRCWAGHIMNRQVKLIEYKRPT